MQHSYYDDCRRDDRLAWKSHFLLVLYLLQYRFLVVVVVHSRSSARRSGFLGWLPAGAEHV